MSDDREVSQVTLRYMKYCGSSFYAKLAELYVVADESNRKLLMHMFGVWFDHYAGLAAAQEELDRQSL